MNNYDRIASLIDIERMEQSTITIVGAGGAANLSRNLIRCGLGRIRIIDFDRIELVNIPRQEHMRTDIGRLKVDALKRDLAQINPDADIETYDRDFCSFTDDEIDEHFSGTDLWIFCVDNLTANARGNVTALRTGTSAIYSCVYPGGQAGETVFWTPNHDSCYRCLCGARYKAHEQGSIRTDAPNADVLSVQYVDAITGMIAIGLLTQGAPNFYGRLIEQLGDRNFIQVKIDPQWNFNGRDVFREQLGIAPDNDAYFSWVTIARRDPDAGQPPCPDCVKYRGRQPKALLPTTPCKR